MTEKACLPRDIRTYEMERTSELECDRKTIVKICRLLICWVLYARIPSL